MTATNIFQPNRRAIRRGRSKSARPRLRRQRGLESLEPRQLLAGDTALVDDLVSVRQNSGEQSLEVLSNDLFDDDYAGAGEITSVSFGSEGGRVSISQDRQSLLYSPPADYHGIETFNYFVDGALSANVQVQIDPAARDDSFEVVPDGQVHRLDVLANDPFWAGYEGDRKITLTSVTQRSSSIEIAPDGRSVLYTPDVFDLGSDQFVYIVDGKYPARVTIHVPQVTVDDDYEVVTHSETRRFNVLANDPFWPGYSGDRKITTVISDGEEGSEVRISADGRGIIFTPGAEARRESIRYVVDGRFEEHLFVQTYVPVRNDGATVDVNSTGFPINVTGNDRYYSSLQRREIDVIDRVTAVDATTENGGSVTILPGGQSVAYTAPEGFIGQDEFSYTADGVHVATVFVNVTLPVRNDSEAVIQDTPSQRLAVLENDFRGNGYDGARQITSVSETTAGGTVSLVNNQLYYTPADQSVETDTFTYVIDGEYEASVAVRVQPLAQSDYFRHCIYSPAPITLDVLDDDLFDRGYQGAGLITAVDLNGEGDASLMSIAANGRSLIYTPGGPSYQSYTYTVDGKYSAQATVSLYQHLAADRYVVDQNGGTTEFALLENDFRLDSHRCFSGSYRGPRLITGVSETQHGGTVEISADGRSVNYTPADDFHGVDSFTYTVDGFMESYATISVARYVQDDIVRVAPNAASAIDVLSNDMFSDYLGSQTITSVSDTEAGGAVEVAADGRGLIYTPADDFVGTDRFSYTVDGQLIAEVEVNVQGEDAELYAKFESLDEFQQYLLDDALTRYQHLFGQTYYSRQPFDFWAEDAAFNDAAPGRDFSETNVQVAGVDEADLMEFDADHVYYLAGNDLVIFDAWPAEEIAEISRTPIRGDVLGQYLDGDRLTVVSQTVEYDYPIWFDDSIDIGFRSVDVMSDFAGDWFWPYYGGEYETHVTVFDVTDRAAPRLVQETTMDGQYVQSRRVGDFVYVALSNEPMFSEPVAVELEDDTKRFETAEEYAARIAANIGSMLDEALPSYSSIDGSGDVIRSGLVHEPEDIFKPLSENADSLVSLVSIDMTNEAAGLAGTSGVFTSGGTTVYASLEHFYVFENGYDSELGRTTRILQFDWDGESGIANFTSSGTVPGTMVNQFSADEYDGHLRIATTVHNTGGAKWFTPSENDLFVLQDDGGILEFTGSMQNLARGETTRSVRFMGGRALVTTARRIDPLFAIDVSDPTAPKPEGYLTLPGFNSYMHPVGEDYLITVGTNSPNGGFGPAQVSLFDISTFTQPTMIDEYTFERFSTTEANADHHAFGYFARHGLLAMPSVRRYVAREDQDDDGFAETRRWVTEHQLMVFSIDAAAEPGSNLGVQLVGDIEHESAVRRSGYIGDRLYSLADDSIHVATVEDPDTVVASVTDLVREEPEDPPVPVPFDAAPIFAAAQAEVAARLSAEDGLSVPVTVERQGDRWEAVVRVGDDYYRYEVSDDAANLTDANYEFAVVDEVSWQNPVDPLDINGDGEVSPLDALMISNYAAEHGDELIAERLVVRQIARPGDQGQLYLDANGDGRVNALDALLVSEYLNANSGVSIDTGSLQSDRPLTPTDAAAVDDLFESVRDTVGDADTDGVFGTADLVKVFQIGKYETGENARWSEGDWNGDGIFSSRDIVEAFQRGNYRQ